MEDCEVGSKLYRHHVDRRDDRRRIFALRELVRGECRISRGTRAIIVGKRGGYTLETPPGEKCGVETTINGVHPDDPVQVVQQCRGVKSQR